MITISMPRPEAADVELEPDVILGGPSQERGNRASLGGPIVTSLPAEQFTTEPDLAQFVARSGYDFYLLAMTLSLAANAGSQINDGAVSLTLASGSGQPIAWSMSPIRLRGSPVSTKASGSIEVALGPFLKIGGDWARETSIADCFIYALGELEGDPEWRLRRTATMELTGVHDLAMIVRVDHGVPVDGRIQVSASVSGSRGLFRTRAALPPSHATFRCSAQAL